MSTRHLRAARTDETPALGAAEEGEGEEEPLGPPVRPSLFAAGLLSGEDSGDSGEDSTDEEARPSAPMCAPQSEAASGRSARRGARRKGAPSSPAGGAEEWESAQPARGQGDEGEKGEAGVGAAEPEPWWVAAAWPLRPAFLTPDYELAERFGRRAVVAANAEMAAAAAGGPAARAAPRGAPRARGGSRRGVLAPALAVGAHGRAGRASAGGLSFERDDEAYGASGAGQGGGCLWYRFRYSAAYRTLAQHAHAAALAGDSRALQLLVREAPGHVEALGALAALCERTGHAELASGYLQRALQSYEAAVGPGAALHGGLLDARCRLRWAVPENGAFLRVLSRRAAHASRAGCQRTAAELCRLLAGLTLAVTAEAEGWGDHGPADGRRAPPAAPLLGQVGPAEADPERLLMRIDAHLSRARAPAAGPRAQPVSDAAPLALLRALPALCGGGASLALWPGATFSLALAHRAAADGASAEAQLRRALCLFPAALPVLLLGAEAAGAPDAPAAPQVAGEGAGALLLRWRGAMRAAGRASPPRGVADGEGAADAHAAAWDAACEPSSAPYRAALCLYDAAVGAGAWRADVGAREWLARTAAALSDELLDDAAAAERARGEGAGGVALALARDCAAFRAAEWSAPRSEMAGACLEDLGLCPLTQLPDDALAQDDGGAAGPAAPVGRPARRAGGLRLDLRGSPLLVFLQSFLPWAHAS